MSPGELRSLDAHYLDTEDVALGRRGVAVRRRTGGPDAGWHIKGPLLDGARVELHWDLGETDAVPPALLAALREWGDAPALSSLVPLVRIRNERMAYNLCDAQGAVIAEFADDRVTAWDHRDGVRRSWREWELELGPAAPQGPPQRAALFAAAAAAATAVGAVPAASASKLARALGA